MDSVSEERLAQIHPELANRVRMLAEVLPFPIRVTQGLRSWSTQDAIYNQGRTTPGSIVTNVKGGYSAHNFGYAIDFVVMDKSLPDWNSNDEKWKQVLEIAFRFGLSEGATWRTFPDKPHLYLWELPADPDDEMRYVVQERGLEELWKEWNIKTWESK